MVLGAVVLMVAGLGVPPPLALADPTATAAADSEVLRLSRARLRSVLGRCPHFARRQLSCMLLEEAVGLLAVDVVVNAVFLVPHVGMSVHP